MASQRIRLAIEEPRGGVVSGSQVRCENNAELVCGLSQSCWNRIELVLRQHVRVNASRYCDGLTSLLADSGKGGHVRVQRGFCVVVFIKHFIHFPQDH